MQIDKQVKISKDAVELDGAHSGRAFHGLAKAFLHDLQAFQMCAFGVEQFVDCRLKFPFA